MTKTATKEGYAEYLYNLSAMYKAIEDALDKNCNHPVVKDFITKELYRHELIEKDIKYLLGDKVSSMKLLASTIIWLLTFSVKGINKMLGLCIFPLGTINLTLYWISPIE